MKAVVLTKKAMILEYVEVVRFEIEGGKKKNISASNDELVQKIWDRLMGEAMNFSTEKELRRHLESVTREMLWLEANTEESDEIIRRLKSGDASFTEDFFYDTDPKGCNISRFRSKILSQIKRTYGVEVTVKEFGTLLYTFCGMKALGACSINIRGRVASLLGLLRWHATNCVDISR